MKLKSILSVFLVLFILSCVSKEKGSQTDDISGSYVTEYSFIVIHPERGDTIGVRTIKDTIFIRQKDQGYEVSNNKWKLNDYDQEGWQSMEHAEDRSFAIFSSKFNPSDSSISNDSNVKLYLDFKN